MNRKPARIWETYVTLTFQLVPSTTRHVGLIPNHHRPRAHLNFAHAPEAWRYISWKCCFMT